MKEVGFFSQVATTYCASLSDCRSLLFVPRLGDWSQWMPLENPCYVCACLLLASLLFEVTVEKQYNPDTFCLTDSLLSSIRSSGFLQDKQKHSNGRTMLMLIIRKWMDGYSCTKWLEKKGFLIFSFDPFCLFSTMKMFSNTIYVCAKRALMGKKCRFKY